MNKQTITVGIIVGALLVSPFLASALTIEDLQTQLKALLNKVMQLQTTQSSNTVFNDTNVGSSGVISVTAVPRICAYEYAGSLGYGNYGDGVVALQEFLRSEGVFNAGATGFFGIQTQTALQKWQASQGVVSSGSARTSGWGVLGPLTRAQINTRCDTADGTRQNFDAQPRSGIAPMDVQFTFTPSSDDSAQYYIEYGDGQGGLMNRQQIYCIRAPCISPSTSSHTYTALGDYTATVNRYIACLYSNPRCMMAQPEPLASLNIHVGGSAGNRAPTISSFSGPTSLPTSSQGTWTIQASDPENGQLTYAVTWGDEYVYATSNTSASASKQEVFTQTNTFSHSYVSAGIYTVSIVVSDSSGLEARTSSTVRVGAPVACTLQYEPVCGRPQGCMNTCAPGMYCTMACRLYDVQTYSNRCQLDAAGAEYLYYGACTGNVQ